MLPRFEYRRTVDKYRNRRVRGAVGVLCVFEHLPLLESYSWEFNHFFFFQAYRRQKKNYASTIELHEFHEISNDMICVFRSIERWTARTPAAYSEISDRGSGRVGRASASKKSKQIVAALPVNCVIFFASYRDFVQ